MAVRVEVDPDDEKSRAQMWMRVDRPQHARPHFFDNMGDRPITSREWSRYEITGMVDADADDINIGLMVFGEATAWLDDVRFELLPNDPPP